MIDALIEYNYRYSKTKRLISPVIIQEYYSCNFEEMETYLNNNYGVNPKKSFDYYKKLYPDTWLEIAINSETYKDKKIVKKLLSFCSYQDMIDYMVGKFGVTFIVQKLKNKIFSFYYGTNFKDMFNYLVSKDVYIAAKFGHMRHFNGHLCRSDGEFILANFLKENDILYEYERKYPNSNKRCDFYLIDVNFYVEFTGMVKFTEKNDAYESKKRFCLENDLNHLFSNNIDQIKKKITELYEIND